MHMRLGVSVAVLLGLAGLQARAQELKSEEDRMIYALGLSMSRAIESYELSPAEIELLKKGLTDGLTEAKPAVDLKKYGPRLPELAKLRKEKAGKQFLARAAREKGAKKLASGVIYKELKPGTGASPKATDVVKVNYRGTLTNGTEFDSSARRGQALSFPLDGVIPCWTEGMQKMKVGGKAQLICPSETAYGKTGSPPMIPPDATLVFDVELVGLGEG
jgi:FKBP-type peptidyl-prolyl cis-trans isomerase FkpA